MKIFKSIEESGLLVKVISKIIVKRCKKTKRISQNIIGRDRAFILNLDKYKSIGTQWIALYVNAENVTYFEQKNNAFYQNVQFVLNSKSTFIKGQGAQRNCQE